MYKKWWFWVGVVVIAIGAFYVKGYIAWQGEGAVYDEYAKMTADYVAQQKVQSAALEKAYREDIYGGATPEETLQLYVEALEKGDFELASKYWIPEEQDEEASILKQSKDRGNLEKFGNILRTYKKKVSISDDSKRAEIEFFDASGIQTDIEFLQINPFTQKWKLYSNQ